MRDIERWVVFLGFASFLVERLLSWILRAWAIRRGTLRGWRDPAFDQLALALKGLFILFTLLALSILALNWSAQPAVVPRNPGAANLDLVVAGMQRMEQDLARTQQLLFAAFFYLALQLPAMIRLTRGGWAKT